MANCPYHLTLLNTVYDFMNKPVNREKGNKNKQTKKKSVLYNALLVFVTTELAFSKLILEVETPVFIPCLLHRTSNNAAHISQCSYKNKVHETVFFIN